MTSSNSVRRAVCHALFVSAVAASAAAGAQEAGKVLDKVVVTGSRIVNNDLSSAVPVQTIGAADIEAAGVANIQDILLKSPVFGTPTLSRTNSNFLTSSAGVSTVDLRDLGTARTLVLVNGRRFVAGIPGESAVDLNTIPAQFIERVEVLTGGASAVYGSDAVAGVVNIIYKKNFEGVEFASQYGGSTLGDDEDTQLSVTMGTNVADGRGNILAHLGYTKQGAVYSRDRDRSDVDQISVGAGLTGAGEDFFTVQRPFYSSFAPQGRFFSGPDQYTYNAANALITGFSTNGTATRAPDGFNRSAYRTIAVPTERYLAATQGTYEIADNHSAFMEATYASSKTKSVLEPFPLGAEAIYPASGGQVPIEFPVFTPNLAVPGTFLRTLLVNPIVPATIAAAATDTDGDGLRDIYFTRRLAEIGARGNVADRDTFRVLGGAKGSFGESTWGYEGFYSFGQTKESQVSSGQVNVLNFRNALEAVPDVDDIDGDTNLTEAICRDAQARDQGCVPANVFGHNSLSPDAVKYIQAPGLLATYTSQKNAGLNFTGELFDLPAGAVGLAVGGEYRWEFARSEFDPLQQAGLNAGNAIPRTEGGFSVAEGYIETRVPILKDKFLADSLDFNGAFRLSNYTTVGNAETWNIGMEWAPISQVRFRVTRAQSTRAPNINELYSPPSQTFPTGLNDPCVGVTATSAGTYDVVCRAAPGVLANITANGAFTENQADLQGKSGYDRGNPNAQEEIGHSWVVGMVISPDGIPVLSNFDITIDYFDIEIDDALVSTPRQFILNQCYSGNASFCQFVTRRPTVVGANSAGSLEFIDSAVTNSGGFATEGIDVTVHYSQELEDWGLTGDLVASLSYTHVMNGYLVPLPGEPQDPFAGEIGSPKHNGFASIGYKIGDFGVTWQTTYIGRSDIDDQFLPGYEWGNGAPVLPGQIGVGSITYHDVQFAYSAGEKFKFYVGAKNVFDKEPPPIITPLPASNTGVETDAGTYDPIGRRLYAGVRVKF